MHDFWQTWPGKMSAEWVNEVMIRGMQLPAAPGVVGVADGVAEHTMRKSIVRWFDPVIKHRDTADTMRIPAEYSNRVNFGFDIRGMWELQFAEYHADPEAPGKYDWHQDVFLTGGWPYQRKLTVVVQLSEPGTYEGGAFEFFEDIPNPRPDQFMPRGSVLVFPSFMPHRVTPVTRGVRYSLTGWLEGPAWR